MSRRIRRIPVHPDPGDVRDLARDELEAILRGADSMIMRGGRTLLMKVLRGSREKRVLELELDQVPVYGRFRHLSNEETLARIDRAIVDGYLRIEYDGRLPLLVFTDAGWSIEKETYACELLSGFDDQLAAGPPFHMAYLKDRNRAMIWRLLDLVEETGDPKYIPLLQAWQQIDYRKVRERLRRVIGRIG